MSCKDETYIINLCDCVLGLTAERNQRFDFLRGDPRRNGKEGAMLPVDAYYPSLSLVYNIAKSSILSQSGFSTSPTR